MMISLPIIQPRQLSSASSAHPLSLNKSVVFSFLQPSQANIYTRLSKSKAGAEHNSSGCQP